MKTILTIAVIIFTACITLNAQVTQEWIKTYNGTGNNNDEAISIKCDASGNVVVEGIVISTGNNNDFYTVKYNSSGVQQWAVLYNGPANNADVPVGLVIDASSNIYVCGHSRNSSLS